MAHGMLLDPPGKTVHVWNVTVRSAVLRKHTEHSEEIVLHLCVYIFFTVFCRFPTPIFGDDCFSVFDKEACEFKVYKKDDPSISCPIHASVLK